MNPIIELGNGRPLPEGATGFDSLGEPIYVRRIPITNSESNKRDARFFEQLRLEHARKYRRTR